MTITVTLEEILRQRPELLAQLKEEVKNQGKRIDDIGIEPTIAPEHLCKLSQYVKAENDKGNASLQISVNAIKSLAILDTGAGVSIITKETWEKWGKDPLQPTRMGLQLADGKIKYPLGLIENIQVKVCGIHCEHSFVVVDFDQETNYEVILGRPFMRQMMVVQD